MLGEGVVSSSIVIRKRLSEDLCLYWASITNHIAQLHKIKLRENTCMVDKKVFGCHILSEGNHILSGGLYIHPYVHIIGPQNGLL